jgi:hypothetical protein
VRRLQRRVFFVGIFVRVLESAGCAAGVVSGAARCG